MSGYPFAAVSVPLASPDPAKHVNFTSGMVLGAYDLTQDFAYLSERVRWLARDLLGYGTVWGLHVTADAEGGVPRVVVTPGVALTPRGQLVHVPYAQRALLDDWLRVRLDDVAAFSTGRLADGSSDTLTLYIVLCYRACPVDPVPVVSGPCRSEDEPTSPSRVADDFQLELRLDPPPQSEEDAVRDFVRSLTQLEVTDGGGASLDDFLNELRLLHREAGGSPPLASPPPGLRIPKNELEAYIRAALRLWITEIRPDARPHFLHEPVGLPATCQTGDDPGACVQLARVDVALHRDGASTEWRIDPGTPLAVREERRPLLAHLRFLQELLLIPPLSPPPATGSYAVVAAGRVEGGAVTSGVNGLAVVSSGDGRIKLTFVGYRPPAPAFDYVVKALPSSLPGSPDPRPVLVDFGGYESDGFVLSLANPDGTPVLSGEIAALGLMVEVSRWGT